MVWTVWKCLFKLLSRPKLFSQMVHLCGWIFSWTHSMCLFWLLCWKDEYSHKSHLNFFLFSWTIWTCLLRFPFSPKHFSQMLHWCCFRFSWSHSMWSLRPLCAKEEKSHKSHWYFFLFSWTVWKCLLRFDLMLKLLWQMWHRCSLSFSWTHLMWPLSLEFSHKSHWKGLPFSWTALMCCWRVDLYPKDILQTWQFRESSFRWNFFVWYFRSCLTPNDLLQ